MQKDEAMRICEQRGLHVQRIKTSLNVEEYLVADDLVVTPDADWLTGQVTRLWRSLDRKHLWVVDTAGLEVIHVTPELSDAVNTVIHFYDLHQRVVAENDVSLLEELMKLRRKNLQFELLSTSVIIINYIADLTPETRHIPVWFDHQNGYLIRPAPEKREIYAISEGSRLLLTITDTFRQAVEYLIEEAGSR